MAVAALSLETQSSLLEWSPEPRPVLLPDPPPGESPSQSEVISRLRASLAGTAAANVMNAAELVRALDKVRREGSIPTTLAPFDTLLGGGLPRGKLVELTGRRATGRFSIVLSALAAATSVGEAAVLVDLGDHLDPQLAEANGAALERLLWIRPSTLKQAVMSAEMIMAAGFPLVVLDLGLPPLRGPRVPDAAWVRLGRTAEAQGTALLVSTPYALTGTASEALIIAAKTRMLWLGRGNSPRILAGATTELRLEKHRHRKAGARTILTLSACAEIPKSPQRVILSRTDGEGSSNAATLASCDPSPPFAASQLRRLRMTCGGLGGQALSDVDTIASLQTQTPELGALR